MRKILCFAVTLLMVASVVLAGDDKRRGTSGAEELLIPVGARSIATAGAFLPSVKGVEAIFYNPAGLSAASNSEVMFSHMSYLADIGVQYLAVSANFENIGAFGLSIKTLNFGDIPVTTFEDPDGSSGTTYSPGFYVVGLTYSRAVTDRVSAGVNAKVISESIMNTNATGMAFDLGIQYHFARYLSIGATIKNVGSNMKFTGSDLQTRTVIPGSGLGSGLGTYSPETETFQLPSYFEMGATYAYEFSDENLLTLGATFRNNNNLNDLAMFGLEFQTMNILSVRGGYETTLKNAGQSIYGLTAGAGIEYDVTGSMRLSFDYAFQSVTEFPTSNHIFTVKLGI